MQHQSAGDQVASGSGRGARTGAGGRMGGRDGWMSGRDRRVQDPLSWAYSEGLPRALAQR
jgi:hypothetical protein